MKEKKRIAKLELAAARYEWLRKNHIKAHVQVRQSNGDTPYVYGDQLDRSIDFHLELEARAQSVPQSKV